MVEELVGGGAAVGAPGLWLYCNDAGDGAPVPPLTATAALPRNVDIGGSDAALVTADPRIGAAGSPFGDMAEYACNNSTWHENHEKLEKNTKEKKTLSCIFSTNLMIKHFFFFLFYRISARDSQGHENRS